MAPRQRGPQPVEPPSESGVSVSPVVVFSREFPARPSALPDAHAFVRATLAAADVEAAPHAAVTQAINDALLAAAGPEVGAFLVVIRLFPGEAEIEVLSGAAATAAAVPQSKAGEADSFAQWLADVLRAQGLSQEAAARQLGVSVRTVSRWLRGHTEPRMRDVRRLSDRFGPVPPNR